MKGLKVGCEICEDIWVADSPANSHAKAGATVIVNLSASDETVGKDEYREMLVKASSARNIAGYVYTALGKGNPPRIWYLAAIILSRKTERCWHSRKDLRTRQFMEI